MRPLCADWREAGVWCALKRLVLQAGWTVPDWVTGGDFGEAARTAGGRREAAAARVEIGAQLEAYATRAVGRTWVGLGCVECQLYYDAYCAAVWTSAHAEYLAASDGDIQEPATPSIGTVPCAASGLDLSDLYARRVASKNEGYPKVVEPLVQLLGRCTNPGARGWDAVLKDTLEHSGTRTVVMHAVHTCLLGLHPQLHPAFRADWKQRMRILRLLPQTSADIKAAAPHIKEAVRRCLASTMASSPAMHTALSRAGHPVRHLLQPPAQFPHAGMEGAMTAFADAGRMLITGIELPQALSDAFAIRSIDRSLDQDGTSFDGLSWEPGWLGTLHCATLRRFLLAPLTLPLSTRR